MARPLRVEFDGAWYHVMNRGAGHRRVFLTRRDYLKFLALLGDVAEIFDLETHGYCLLGNHYHLLVHTPTAGLSRAMRHLDGVYTQYFNRRTERDGPLFRGRYHAILVDADAYRLQVSRYIHLNPVDAGLVDRPVAYDWSSYRAYLEPRGAPDWLVMSSVLDEFGPRDARGEYRRFVEMGIDSETRAFYEAPRIQPVFGGDAFKALVQARVDAGPSREDREIPDARRVRSRPSLPVIADAVAIAFNVDTNTLRATTRGRGANATLARCAAIYLARHEAGAALASAASWLGYRSYNSAAAALALFRRRLKEPEVLARLREARELIYKVET